MTNQLDYKPSLLVVGLGGYIESTVLPALASMDVNISVISQQPVNALNIERLHGYHAVETLEKGIEQSDFIFLATPPTEYPDFLKKIPADKGVWLEKPLCELSLDSLEEMKRTLSERKGPVYVGMLKRNLVEDPTSSSSWRGQISLDVGLSGGWRGGLRGGELWADGIHAIDLAYLLLGTDAEVTNLQRTHSKLTFSLKGEKGDLTVEIGDVAQKVVLNGVDYSEKLAYEFSQEFLVTDLTKWFTGESNLDSCVAIHRKAMTEVFV